MKPETKDFPEIGILESFFRWKKLQERNFLETTRSSPEITFPRGDSEMTERSEFLSLVERFLSWWSYPGVKRRNASLYEEDGRTFVLYDMIEAGGSSKRVMAFGSGFECCVSPSISYMCICTETSGKEELDLFLSSRGF